MHSAVFAAVRSAPAQTQTQALLAVDADSGNVFVLGDSTISVVAAAQGPAAVRPVLDLADACGPDTDAVAIHFVPDTQALCIAFCSGTITLAYTDNGEEFSRTETVGFIDSGILSMQWSPDSQLVVFVTGDGNLVEMTQDFEVVTELPIHTDSLGEAMPINVGWGKKETQFHGTAGKQAAKASNALEMGVNHLSADDDQLPRLSWRGDGQFFACSAVDHIKFMRIIRVYSREGVLQNTCEFLDQLGHALSWRPSGTLIASSQHIAQRHEIVFFEKNGLRHGEFSLPDPSVRILDLQWNCDSSALAILIAQNSSSSPSAIQIWMSNNYHWYLKQEIQAASTSNLFKFMSWDPLVSNRLHMLENDRYRSVEYSMDVLISTSLSAKNQATVAVIDGNRLLFTPFRHKNVPPPMSYAQIKMNAPVCHVAFSPEDAASDIVVLLSNGSIQFCKNIDKTSAEIQQSGVIQLPKTSRFARQIIWPEQDTIMVLEHDLELNKDVVSVYSFDPFEPQIEITEVKTVALPSQTTSFVNMYYNSSLRIPAIQSATGDVFELLRSDSDWSVLRRETFPDVCPWMAVVEIGPDAINKEIVWIGLSARNKLFSNHEVMSVECTSFSIHNEFFIATTMSHTARFLPLSRKKQDFRFDTGDLSNELSEQHRRVERGSRIVAAPPTGISLVLQMPRGNLETIYPRALVLSSIAQALSRLDYATAFFACRKHRIDMNIIVDFDSEGFKDHLFDFISQVSDPESLNLFISSLKNENVITTTYRLLDRPLATEIPDKVNLLCQLISESLERLGDSKYIQPILTSDARRQPPNLETAMCRIHAVKQRESSDAAEAALKYLVFLADANKLYDVALGMYDFPLVVMVAQHTQKDPREYLSFLSELQKLPKFYQRFKIDDHLARHASALRNLVQAGSDHFNEALAYTKRHTLFKLAIDLYPKGTPEHKAVLVAFAEFHSGNENHDEAGLLYEMAGKLPLALEEYVNACAWREAISVAHVMGLSNDEIRHQAEILVRMLLESRDHLAASRIIIDILQNPERAISVLVEGSLWNEAILTSNVYGLPHLKDALVRPALTKAAADIVAEVDSATTTFENQRLRLHQVREQKQQRVAARTNGTGDGDFGAHDSALDNIDIMSDTTSMANSHAVGSVTTSRASASTARTGKTAKQRRKLARKRAAGKDSAFEDEFLIRSLSDTIGRFNTLVAEVRMLIRCLMTFDETALAHKVQKSFRSLHTVIENSLTEIFTEPSVQHPEPSVDPLAENHDVDSIKKAPLVKPVLSTEKWWTDSLDA